MKPLQDDEEHLRISCSLQDIVFFMETVATEEVLLLTRKGKLEAMLRERVPTLRKGTLRMNRYLLNTARRPGGPGSGRDLTSIDDLRASPEGTACVPVHARMVGQLMAVARAASLWQLVGLITVDRIDRERRFAELLIGQIEALKKEAVERSLRYSGGRAIRRMQLDWTQDEKAWHLDLVVERDD